MLPGGTLLGRYRVDALAAIGGMGAVYRGTDTVLQRAVALKVLPADKAGDASMAERFACESLQAASLSHPHVLPVYDAGEAEGVSYVAMQWVDGATLEQLIVDEGPLDLERAVDVTDAIAGALDHAHEHGLVHRDVKPGNVMVDGAGNAYLMDFGLSVRTDRTSAVTRTGEFLATVDYAAPEQIEGREVDRRADVYGLAGLAFRCLTGKVPFERDSPVARLYAHLSDEPPVAHELRPAVPPAVSETIRRGLAKRPEDRPPTAGAFAAELRAALVGAPEDTMPFAVMAAEPEPAASPAARRTRRVLAGAAATVLAAFGGMSVAGITGGGTPSGDLPTAGAGQRESRDAKTSKTTTAAESAAAPAVTDDAPPADKAKAKKQRKKAEKERDEPRSEADGGLSGAGAGPDGSTPSSTPSPSAAPASGTSAPQPSSAGGTAPSSSSGTQTQTQTQTQPAETTPAPPAQTTPAETTPAQTTPAEPPPSETTPTETTPGG